MNRRSLLATGAAVAISGCSVIYETIFRYRLKVYATANGEDRTGESVIAVRWRQIPNFMAYSGVFKYSIRAEAAVVDLGDDHGLLFALFDAPNNFESADTPRPQYFSAAHSPLNVYFSEGELHRSNEGRRKAWSSMSKQTEENDVTRNNWPLLVRFEDIANPATVVQVPIDRIRDIYGGAVSLSRITVQATDQPTTEKIEQILPWLKTFDGPLAGRAVWGSSTRSLGQALYPGHFKASGGEAGPISS